MYIGSVLSVVCSVAALYRGSVACFCRRACCAVLREVLCEMLCEVLCKMLCEVLREVLCEVLCEVFCEVFCKVFYYEVLCEVGVMCDVLYIAVSRSTSSSCPYPVLCCALQCCAVPCPVVPCCAVCGTSIPPLVAQLFQC